MQPQKWRHDCQFLGDAFDGMPFGFFGAEPGVRPGEAEFSLQGLELEVMYSPYPCEKLPQTTKWNFIYIIRILESELNYYPSDGNRIFVVRQLFKGPVRAS